MGFFDNLKDALGGDKDDDDTTGSTPAAARHVDRDAPADTTAVPHVVGGKHAQRD